MGIMDAKIAVKCSGCGEMIIGKLDKTIIRFQECGELDYYHPHVKCVPPSMRGELHEQGVYGMCTLCGTPVFEGGPFEAFTYLETGTVEVRHNDEECRPGKYFGEHGIQT